MKHYFFRLALCVILLGGCPPLEAVDAPKLPNPRWRIQVVIIDQVHMKWTDAAGLHDVTTEMTPQEIELAIAASKRFFEVDVPALNSGLMVPVLTISRRPTPLTRLAAPSCFWPDPVAVRSDLQPVRFDSSIVIWKDDGWDSAQRRFVSLACFGGFPWPRGTSPTYASFTLKMISPEQRNVFKNEWGHSIVSYYNATGAAPRPAVDNRINDTDTRYVSCQTGQPYTLLQETDWNPIPNSIYNNHSGFTHDYYSGLTATPDRPDRCLGITPAAWASGGPLSRPIRNPGDLNGDGRVDQRDLIQLMAEKNDFVTLPGDPRDLDYDGRITVLDARRLVTFCTKPGCLPY